ncbi:L-serine ammonia-lyase [Oxalobacteraceae bacterium R-40]|uniref:L-serine dehydratase n=1 Tax=Keguizhuia sedimenti TaxID=3064264 RepID=A0ABU1BKX3_9BURK|nr:L-serine ammonia-lyase [Oxalobacteraceae bacterium R-40]
MSAISIFDLFKIGIGPSSSHTVGPMRAALLFARHLQDSGILAQVAQVKVDLYGSLGATGKGHGTDKGVMLGLMGHAPDMVDPDNIPVLLNELRTTGTLNLLGQHGIPFRDAEHIGFFRHEVLKEHPNGMKFQAFDHAGNTLAEKTYLSVGGGFVLPQGAMDAPSSEDGCPIPHPFDTGDKLLKMCAESGKTIAQAMLENETCWRPEQEVRANLLRIWEVMQDCVRRGCHASGELPGPLKVRRRAPDLYAQLSQTHAGEAADPLAALDWLNLYAMAVNEENAAGGRVVTAPTNGAAGIIPAVLHYYQRFIPGANEDGIATFLLTAGAIGILYKLNASISGAEVGCQGEVGVACSMAAGGLCAALGGSNEQVENAAEIGMEHNLGLTCDPVGGQVQIPCIERNAMGAGKAVNAARMALRGDGTHYISLDMVIKTMKETGADMKTKYKETSRGGLALAVNIVEC